MLRNMMKCIPFPLLVIRKTMRFQFPDIVRDFIKKYRVRNIYPFCIILKKVPISNNIKNTDNLFFYRIKFFYDQKLAVELFKLIGISLVFREY